MSTLDTNALEGTPRPPADVLTNKGSLTYTTMHILMQRRKAQTRCTTKQINSMEANSRRNMCHVVAGCSTISLWGGPTLPDTSFSSSKASLSRLFTPRFCGHLASSASTTALHYEAEVLSKPHGHYEIHYHSSMHKNGIWNTACDGVIVWHQSLNPLKPLALVYAAGNSTLFYSWRQRLKERIRQRHVVTFHVHAQCFCAGICLLLVAPPALPDHEATRSFCALDHTDSQLQL